MNLLIFGGQGLVGSALIRMLSTMGHHVRAPGRQDFDISSEQLSPGLLDSIDCAINAAVVKDQNCVPVAASERVNVDFPQKLCRLCHDRGAAMIHLSSDGVFQARGGPYYEDDVPDAEDAYGRQKIASEPEDCLVLRTSVIGPEQSRFTGLLCWLLRQEGRCPGFTNHLWNGVTSFELAQAIHRILCKGLVQPGVRHLYADDVSKHELLQLLAEAFGRQIEIEPIGSPHPRDQRLGTRHRDFLAACAIQPLRSQIANLLKYADAHGRLRNIAYD